MLTTSDAARLLGQIRTAKKAAASRENGKKGGGQIKALASIVCNCDGEGLNHKTTCRRGQAIRYRTKKGLPLS